MKRIRLDVLVLLTCLVLAWSATLGFAQESNPGLDLSLADLKHRANELRPWNRAPEAGLAASEAGMTAQAASCNSWLKIVPPDSPSLLSVDFSGATWMAVGSGGDVEVSTDASTWTWHYTGVYKTLSAVRFFNSRFVAVGEEGLILWSVDGHTWSQPGSPTSNELRGLAVGANHIVAVGRAGTILWSADGVAWSPAASATTADIFSLTYFQGRFIAIDDDGWVLDSIDGISWQKRVLLPSYPSYGSILGIGASSGLLVAVGYDVTLVAPGGGVIYTSADGASWQKQTPPVPTLRGAAFGGDQWVAVGDSVIVESANGISWSQVPSPLSDRIWDVAWGANKFVAVGWKGIAVSGCTATPAPTANFSWSPASPRAGQEVQFADLSTGSPASWSWNFGDGTTSTASNPSHTYTSAGTRSVTLTVSNSTGTNSVTKQISVAAAAILPVANFTWSPQNPVAGQTVQFTDLSTNSPQSWSWNIAGQGVSGLQNPSYTFQAGGSFLVTLIVTNEAGSSSIAKTVTVSENKPASSYWVPVASHASGLNQSQWRSDLGLLNPGTAMANVQIKFYGSGGIVVKTTSVPGGAQSILTDVVEQLAASGSGAIEILSDQPLWVTTRTYNQVSPTASCYAGGTQGQDYPAVVTADGLASGQKAYLAGLSENTSYRCNIGMVNTGSVAATVLVELYDGAGAKLTDYTVALAVGQWAQETQPFRNKAGQTVMDRGYAKITVQSGSGVFAFASLIDNITNDPTPMRMQR
jgi:PKD repeat protein